MKTVTKIILMCVVLVMVSSSVLAQMVEEPPGPPQEMWKGLIGEAVSEGRGGMKAIALCYRNRLEAGLPLGCVAMKRKDLDAFVRRQGSRYERIAKSIVEEVFYGHTEDVTKGATHYENLEAFGEPYWWDSMEVTVKVGVHTFCKEK